MSDQEERDAIANLVLQRREVRIKLAAASQALEDHARRLDAANRAVSAPSQAFALGVLTEPLPTVETLRRLVEEWRDLTARKADLDARFRVFDPGE